MIAAGLSGVNNIWWRGEVNQIGSRRVQGVYLGDTKVWPPAPVVAITSTPENFDFLEFDLPEHEPGDVIIAKLSDTSSAGVPALATDEEELADYGLTLQPNAVDWQIVGTGAPAGSPFMTTRVVYAVATSDSHTSGWWYSLGLTTCVVIKKKVPSEDSMRWDTPPVPGVWATEKDLSIGDGRNPLDLFCPELVLTGGRMVVHISHYYVGEPGCVGKWVDAIPDGYDVLTEGAPGAYGARVFVQEDATSSPRVKAGRLDFQGNFAITAQTSIELVAAAKPPIDIEINQYVNSLLVVGDKLYIATADWAAPALLVLDAKTGQLLKTVPVSRVVLKMAAIGTTLYLMAGEEEILIFDTVTDTETGQITGFSYLDYIISSGTKLYVEGIMPNPLSGAPGDQAPGLFIIDTLSKRIISQDLELHLPRYHCPSRVGDRMLICEYFSGPTGTVANGGGVFDTATDTVIKQFPELTVGTSAGFDFYEIINGVAYGRAPNGTTSSLLVAVDITSSDPSLRYLNYTIGDNCQSIAAIGTRLYFSNNDYDNPELSHIGVYDTATETELDRIPVPGLDYFSLVSAGDRLYILDSTAETVTILHLPR